MDKNAIKKFAVWARRELISRVSQKAVQYGITEESFGDPNADSVNGRVLSKAEKTQRQRLIQKIKAEGYRQVMEEVAYTWFNRFIALRFMEVNGYLPSHVRVFTDDQGAFNPQILAEAIHLDLDGLDMEKVYAFKEANQTDELYKYLLIVQCNALNPILPGMFQKIEDYTEILFPDNLLREGSVIDRMVRQGESDSIPESDWTDQVQIIGWLYQYYNTEPKDQAFADLKKNIKITKEKIPAATQLFTPDWIVRYMVENSLGRLWVEGHPSAKEKFLPEHNEDGSVRKEEGKWNYYLEEAPQEPEVEAQLAEIRREYAALTPEEIRVIDPCCGSGHILCYLFDVLEQIYEDYGYTAREAAQKIVQHNLHGLDIDPRAVQLSYFAVMMKARQYDRRFFSRNIQPMIYSPEGYPEGMEYGSLITVDELEPAPDYDNWTLHDGDYKTALNRWSFRYVLHQKYHIIVTNPPYMGSSGMGDKLSNYVKDHYPDTKSDLSTICMERCLSMCSKLGFVAMINIPVWMFLSSYEKMRQSILVNNTYISMVHPGRGIFGSDFGTTTFVIAKNRIPGYIASYRRLFKQQGEVESINIRESSYLSGIGCYYSRQDSFTKIPGSPVAYWVSDKFYSIYDGNKKFRDIADIKSGVMSGDDGRFTRLWFEVSILKFDDSCENIEASIRHKTKWFPVTRGGAYRKWYGNLECVINLFNGGYEIEHENSKNHRLRDPKYYFLEGITWSMITAYKLSVRYVPKGILFGNGGPTCFFNENPKFFLAALNSKVAEYIISVVNPSLNTVISDIEGIPIIDCDKEAISIQADRCISLSKQDWDSYETSWDFKMHPLMTVNREYMDGGFTVASVAHYYNEEPTPSCPIEACFLLWQQECDRRFLQLKQNEEELNRIFIDIYGLQDELTPEVEDKDVTVRKADLCRDIRSFISYAVGCMFGRYSIYKEGLIYAGGEWDYNQYEDFAWVAAGRPEVRQFYSGTHFFPDEDNIIPITDDEYFHDDIANRFMEFVSVVYGSETLEENLRFIADALGGKGTPRDVIRNYFLNDFYADHLKVYQKRPIYWLFDSGKKNGFKCLIYMHRYQPDTIARIRTDYVHELQGRYRTAIADLERRMTAASTAERVKLGKQLAKLQDQAEELRAYEEKIHHLADQMIPIDLDDGVKVNYAKFQDVLAKIK